MRTYSAIMTVFVRNGTDVFGRHFYHFSFEATDSFDAKNKLLAECRKRLRRFKIRGNKYAAIDSSPHLEDGRSNPRKLLRNREKFSSLPTILNPRMTGEKLFVEGSGPKVWAEIIKK